jgi:hypothetical protein
MNTYFPDGMMRFPLVVARRATTNGKKSLSPIY